MVLYVLRWEILPERQVEYNEWLKTAIPRQLRVPGLIELRAYRVAAGSGHVVGTYEFADLAAWAAWWSHEEVQKVIGESRNYTSKVTTELWGPSPLASTPFRPGQ